MSECASYVSSAATTAAAAAATTGAGVVSVREQAATDLRLDLHGSISSSRESARRKLSRSHGRPGAGRRHRSEQPREVRREPWS